MQCVARFGASSGCAKEPTNTIPCGANNGDLSDWCDCALAPGSGGSAGAPGGGGAAGTSGSAGAAGNPTDGGGWSGTGGSVGSSTARQRGQGQGRSRGGGRRRCGCRMRRGGPGRATLLVALLVLGLMRRGVPRRD